MDKNLEKAAQEVDEIYGKNKKAREEHNRYEAERQKALKDALDQQNRMLSVEEESKRKIEELRRKGWVK
jgi:hypothetical protein